MSERTRLVLWARSAGRCHYCNKDLIGDLLSGNAELVKGLVAHIVAESPGGPRGHPGRSLALADDLKNLMLLCHEHHREIDDRQTRHLYPEARLLAMKRAHEYRIRTQSSITGDKATHILRFGARIGSNEALVALPEMQAAVFPDHYPATLDSIDLEMTGCQFTDHEPQYWQTQQENLRRQIALKLAGRIERGELRHLSVFALAPQPLLMELGRSLCDIVPADIYQRHREPATWEWPQDGTDIEFEVGTPKEIRPRVALKLAISATVSDDRIMRVLGEDISIWSVASKDANNDILKTRSSLRRFRQLIRRLFHDIKAAHGEHAEINIFPAMPVATAVELGRVWMPKADLPMLVFDQNNVRDGFIKTLEIRATKST